MNEDKNIGVLDNDYYSCNKPNKTQNGRDEEENNKLLSKREPHSPMEDIHKAFEECKFGRFHIRLLFTTFAGFVASILVNDSTSFLLPIAECDLNMNLREKGVLTAMPLFGTYISSIIGGFLIDTFGRIRFLKLGYLGLFIFTLFSSASQNYEIAGIANSGIMSITAEFCHPTVQDRVMLCQSAFATMAHIICPAMAWGILMQDWELNFFERAFVLKTWNFYLFAMSFWPLVGYLLFLTLPESPKFLVTQHKYLEAKNILIKVYTENTRKSPKEFPYPNLWKEEINEHYKPETVEKDVSHGFKAQMMVGLRNMKPMFQYPLILYLTITGIMQLIIVGVLDVLRLWFPQLSTIVEHYDIDGSQNLCVLLDNYTANERLRINQELNATLNSTVVCVPDISGTETYVNSIIMGLVCLIPFCISGVIVNKVGKKGLLVVSGLLSIGGLLGIRWAQSKVVMVTLFSVDVAILQTIKSLNQMVLVEVFPTNVRSVAMSIVIFVSRVGTLVGNIGFPILLELGCEVPFYTMTGMVLGLIVLSLFTPKKREN